MCSASISRSFVLRLIYSFVAIRITTLFLNGINEFQAENNRNTSQISYKSSLL